ncbi:hypothetical protein ABLA30_04405 [Xenorhabdus nematophila]|uniref:hypothetical protein n=1 Tax=Xenorhabdus nematophila TaxID=628 RepID=UPI0032B80737
MNDEVQKIEFDESGKSVLLRLVRYIAGIGLVWYLFYISPLWSFIYGTLPACDSQEVSKSLKESYLGSYNINNIEQYQYDMFDAVRHCRMTVNKQVIGFNITWYGESKTKFIIDFE